MRTSPGLALRPLALLAALLPLLATVLATQLSMQQGLVPACNPFVDGCTSISRAARHELPNLLFRLLVMPAGVLQALVWLLLARWLASLAADGRTAADGTAGPAGGPGADRLRRLPGQRR
jgi:hypothetical protein